MTQGIGASNRPLRVAVVGSGPSGFYAAAELLRDRELRVEVDMFDRLPTPYGLVRGGVAPDHQKIKRVVRAYEKTARSEQFRFFGNVDIGADIEVADLYALYDQVVFAHGAASDRRLWIDGEDLDGSYSATEFVGWYNAHPDFQDRVFDLSNPGVVVVGVGNVAMDVARVLARDPEELARTDISDAALHALRQSRVTDIWVLGRRGSAQAAFSPAEIKEIGELEGVDLRVRDIDAAVDPVSQAWLEEHGDKSARANVEYLHEMAQKGDQPAARRVHLRMCTSPVEILGRDGRVTGVRVERNELYLNEAGTPRPMGTGQYETIDASLVLRSVGYRGVPLAGVPFDERRAIVPNVEGRVVDEAGDRVPGAYVVGWAKRGPTGLIGTNRPDSKETALHMLADARTLSDVPHRDADTALAAVRARQPQFISFADWQRIDALEVERGQAFGQIRRKFTTVADMLYALAQPDG